LAKMVQAKVRRLPVVNTEGKLEGLIAMDDVVAPIVLKNSGRGNQPTSQDAPSKPSRSTDSPTSHPTGHPTRRLDT
jgi:CBS domain protein